MGNESVVFNLPFSLTVSGSSSSVMKGDQMIRGMNREIVQQRDIVVRRSRHGFAWRLQATQLFFGHLRFRPLSHRSLN